MFQRLAAVTVLVPSYDEGLAFFRDVLGFAVLEDTPLGPDKRWVVVAPLQGAGRRWCLRFRAMRRQRARLGDQTGGRVGFFLHTADFSRRLRDVARSRRQIP